MAPVDLCDADQEFDSKLAHHSTIRHAVIQYVVVRTTSGTLFSPMAIRSGRPSRIMLSDRWI